MTRAILKALHDFANVAALVALVGGTGLAAVTLSPQDVYGHARQSVACELAAAEPTDFNIEMCTGEPIDLAPGQGLDSGSSKGDSQ